MPGAGANAGKANGNVGFFTFYLQVHYYASWGSIRRVTACCQFFLKCFWPIPYSVGYEILGSSSERSISSSVYKKHSGTGPLADLFPKEGLIARTQQSRISNSFNDRFE